MLCVYMPVLVDALERGYRMCFCTPICIYRCTHAALSASSGAHPAAPGLAGEHI